MPKFQAILTFSASSNEDAQKIRAKLLGDGELVDTAVEYLQQVPEADVLDLSNDDPGILAYDELFTPAQDAL